MQSRNDDPNSIGNILIDMGAIEKAQLSRVLELQKRNTADVMIGTVLIEEDIITARQLQIALQAQRSLRAEDKVERAMAKLAVAQQSSDNVIDLASSLRRKTEQVKRLSTSQGYPRVTSDMLARRNDD